MARRQKFEDNFWAENNQGFEILLQGMKTQISASKELMDFIKERASVEDAHTKTINKLHKQMGHVSDTSTGTFFPVWTVSVGMLHKLAEANNTFVRNLLELAKEIGEYHQSQKDKLKSNMKGEIETAKEAYHMLEMAETAVHKSKKAYEVAHHEHTSLQYELTTAQNLGVAAKIEKVDAKFKKAEANLIHAKQEYTTAVDNHVKQMMEYQGKHKEACAKFETLEEEHLAQMVTFTIQLASALEANVTNVNKVQKESIRKVSDLSVDKLIAFFVQTKGTGKDIPRPEKVRLVKDSSPSPSPSTASGASQSNVSTSSATTSENTSQKGHTSKEKGLKKLFKRGKQAAVDTSATTNGPNTSQPDAEQPEVDEEGYSIRPDNADRISGFNDNTIDSDSDLDDDNDTASKLKNIHIREASNPVTTATVDDIKASLKGLQLPSPHAPILSKAGSLNALNKLNVTDKSPSSSRRTYLSPTESIPVSSSLSTNKTMALSLLDLDTKDADIQLRTPPGMPPPLIPTISGANTTTTTTTDQLPGSGSDKKLSKETTDFADFSANFGDNSTRSPWGDSDTPAGKKTSTPVATTPVSSIMEISTPSTVLAKSTESNAKPSSLNIPQPSASPILPKPPQGTRRRVKTGSSSSQSSSFTASFEGESATASSTAVTTTTTTSTNDTNITTAAASTTSAQQSDKNLLVKHLTTSSDDTTTQDNYENTPPVSTSLSFPLDKSADNNVTRKPVPAPRRNTLDRNLTANSPLALSSLRSPNTSTTSLPSIDVKDDSTTATVQQPNKASFPRLSSSSSSSSNSSVSSTLQSKESTTSSNNNSVVIPIALAIQEFVNASFKGKTGIAKVTGQVDMSFAISFLQQLSSHDPLTFRLSNTSTVEKLQHNRNLITSNDDGSYKFNMTALCSFLNEEASKSPTPAKFYNVQVFRYEVALVNGIDDVPLRLRCFWKCDPMVTNYRIDYKYNEAVVNGAPLTGLAIAVSVDGVVSRHLSKPEGKWSQDQKKLMWQFTKVSTGPQSLQAKFELTEGPSHPSATLVQFNCEGASLSGMQLDLIGQAYRISFKKNKLSSGNYSALPAE